MRRGFLHELARSGRALLLRCLARLSARRVGVVLVYHGIAAATGDRRTEIVPPIGRDAFDQQVRHLARRFTIVPPSEIQTAVARRRRGGRIPVALTFDDDLASHTSEAAPILERYDARAAFFVCGASLDGPRRFWWEDLQDALDRGLVDPADLVEIPPEVVQAAIERRNRGAARLAAAIEELAPASRETVGRALRVRVGDPPPAAGLRRRAVEALAAAGHEIGFHTLRHDRLPPLDDAALDAALEDGRSALEALAGGPLTLISYPHGRADERIADAAERHGFVAGFAGESRPVTDVDDRLLVPRVEPTTSTPGAFAVHLGRLASGRFGSG